MAENSDVVMSELVHGQVNCAFCMGLDEEAQSAALAGLCHIETDWWGPGAEVSFPAPEPFTSHGTRWTRSTDGKVVHACGSLAQEA